MEKICVFIGFVHILLLIYCANQGGNSNENQRSEGDCNDRGKILNTKCCSEKNIWKKKKEKNIVDEKVFSVQDSFMLKKLGLSVAVTLTVSTICLIFNVKFNMDLHFFYCTTDYMCLGGLSSPLLSFLLFHFSTPV